jgi:adenosine deaminase
MTPKLELHLHLEGAAPPKFIAALAKEKHIDIGGIFAPDGSYRFEGFAEFVKIYEAACTTLTRPEDYQRLTRAVLEEQAQNGVIYTEIFLSPDFCGNRDRGAWREYLQAIRE